MGAWIFIFYVLGSFAFLSGFFVYRKSNQVLYGIPYLFLSIVVWMIVQSSIYTIYYLLHLPCASWQFAIYGLFFGVVFWTLAWKKKNWQKYRFTRLDGLAMFLLFVLVCGVGIYQFGTRLDTFHYRSIRDSAYHLSFAYRITTGRLPVKHFFAAINNGLLIDACKGLIPLEDRYRLFIWFDMMVLFLNGALFWATIRLWFRDHFCEWVGIAGMILYVCGHPWNSMIMGTAYFSTGQLLCVFMMYLLLQLCEKRLLMDTARVLLWLTGLALYFSYSLFVPVFILGSAVYWYYAKKQKHPMTFRQLWHSFLFWAFVFVAGVVFFYFAFVKGTIFYVVLMDLFAGGLMYGSLWEDFLFFLPLLALAFFPQRKQKKVFLPAFLLLLEIGYIILFQIGHAYHRISLYYTYKNYASLWMLAFLCAIWLLCQYGRRVAFLFGSYIFPWFCLLILLLTQADHFYYAANPHYLQNNITKACMPLYHYNLQEASPDRGYTASINQLIQYSARMSARKKIDIPMVMNVNDKGWEKNTTLRFYFFRYQALSGHDPMNCHPEEALTAIKNHPAKYHYLTILRDAQKKYSLDQYYYFQKVVWKNKAGVVIKVKAR